MSLNIVECSKKERSQEISIRGAKRKGGRCRTSSQTGSSWIHESISWKIATLKERTLSILNQRRDLLQELSFHAAMYPAYLD